VHLGNVTAKFRSFSKKNATMTFVLVFYSGEVIAAMAVDIYLLGLLKQLTKSEEVSCGEVERM